MKTGDPAVHQTPIHKFHVDAGAKMVEFAGWKMPMFYPGAAEHPGGIHEEHRQVRESGGLFDVSHMGRVTFKGKDAGRVLERLCTRKIQTMADGQCRYTLFCNEQGGVRDDAIVNRLAEDDYLVVCNALNREKLLDHFRQVIGEGRFACTIDDTTFRTAMVAAQGPKVMEFIGRYNEDIPKLKRYHFLTRSLMMAKVIVARTGYTGEDGVEAILPSGLALLSLKSLMGEIDLFAPDAAIKPAGLGARDTLRLEAGMALYGHELGEDICALECGVDFAIAIDKDEDDDAGPYIGGEALKKVRDAGGPRRRIAGINIEGRRTARQGNPVRAGEREIGVISSACLSPTFGRPIAMAFLDVDCTEPGTPVQVDTGRALLEGHVTALPFYKAPKPAKSGS